jgi:ADP-heptose:LPS heptosyltransferase
VAIHPGSGAPTKNWASSRWSEVVDGLQTRLGARVVLTGGPDEQQLVAEVAGGVRSSRPVLAGPTTLGELAALFEACDLVIGGDSGPLHLAAAVGTPTVRLYGPTSVGIFGPWPSSETQRVLQASLPCQPCDNFAAPPCGAVGTPACLHALTVEDVLHAAAAVLDRSPAGRAPLVVSAGDA